MGRGYSGRRKHGLKGAKGRGVPRQEKRSKARKPGREEGRGRGVGSDKEEGQKRGVGLREEGCVRGRKELHREEQD